MAVGLVAAAAIVAAVNVSSRCAAGCILLTYIVNYSNMHHRCFFAMELYIDHAVFCMVLIRSQIKPIVITQWAKVNQIGRPNQHQSFKPGSYPKPYSSQFCDSSCY